MSRPQISAFTCQVGFKLRDLIGDVGNVLRFSSLERPESLEEFRAAGGNCAPKDAIDLRALELNDQTKGVSNTIEIP